MKKYLLFASLLALPFVGVGQVTVQHLPKTKVEIKQYTAPTTATANSVPTPQALPTFDLQKLPFFCRLEYQCNQKSALPVYFRLGDLQYVNELEGKNRH